MGVAEHLDGRTPESLWEDLQLANVENSNLRRHLLWCAGTMQQRHVRELKARICLPLYEGGVTADVAEEAALQERQNWADVDVVCDALEAAIGDRRLPADVDGSLAAIGRLREAAPKEQGVSLAFIREMMEKVGK